MQLKIPETLFLVDEAARSPGLTEFCMLCEMDADFPKYNLVSFLTMANLWVLHYRVEHKFSKKYVKILHSS